MKKYLFVAALSSLIGSVVHAAPVPIPQQNLRDYKEALKMALNQRNQDFAFNCSVHSGDLDQGFDPSKVIDMTTTGTIDTAGSQPFIVLTGFIGDSKFEISGTSSPDYKTLMSLKVEGFSLNKVNNGDLLNPVITKEYQSYGYYLCK